MESKKILEPEISKVLSDEDIGKFGITREEFEGSRLELFLQCLMDSAMEFTHEKSLELMKEYSLSYAEAQYIVSNKLCNGFKKMMNRGD